jgi:hypothetical protein
MAIWYILWIYLVFLWLIGIFYGHLIYELYGHFLNILSHFGMFCHEKSGNPGPFDFLIDSLYNLRGQECLFEINASEAIPVSLYFEAFV